MVKQKRDTLSSRGAQLNLPQKIILSIMLSLLFIILLAHNPFGIYITGDSVEVSCEEFMLDKGFVSRQVRLEGSFDTYTVYDEVGNAENKYPDSASNISKCKNDFTRTKKAEVGYENRYVWAYYSYENHAKAVGSISDAITYAISVITLGLILIGVFKDSKEKARALSR